MEASEKVKRAALLAGGCLVALCLVLLVTGRRVLVWETRVEPGQRYMTDDWGDLGNAEQATLACRYFTGRAIKLRAMWYSPNNILGRDSCPFFDALRD